MDDLYRKINDIMNPKLNTPPDLNNFYEGIAEANAEKAKAIAATSFLADIQKASLASEFADKLVNRISAFNENLDAEHEVGLQLVSFGQSITFHVQDIGYWNPSLIMFTGLTEQKQKVELIQHVSQISFLLMGLPKLDPEKPKRKIGFIQEDIKIEIP